MTTIHADRTVLPPEQSLDHLLALFEEASSAETQPPAELVGPQGERTVLPHEVYEVLHQVVLAMAQGQAVTVAPHHQTLTTQEAADLLDISRPTLVRLLEAGEIPYEQPGRHRRVLLRDVLAYQERRRRERAEALDEMVEISEEADLYNLAATPKRTR